MNCALRKELSSLAALSAAGCLLTNKRGASAVFGLAALTLRLWPTSYSLKGRAVVITGGSRGLGLAIAEQFLLKGSNVVLLARDQDELTRAQCLLRERTYRPPTVIACDMTVPAQVDA